MDEARAPCLVSLWTSKWSSKLKSCFRVACQPGILPMCGFGPEGNHMRGWINGSLKKPAWPPETLLQSHTQFPRLGLLSHFYGICWLSELMLKFVLVPGKQNVVPLYSCWLYTSSHVFSNWLHLFILPFFLILLFIPIKTLSCLIKREH